MGHPGCTFHSPMAIFRKCTVPVGKGCVIQGHGLMISRRSALLGAVASGLGRWAQAEPRIRSPVDVTFLFSSDVHACRMADGLSPNCQAEGKTDQALLIHIRALNAVQTERWPSQIDGMATGFAAAGQPVGEPRGLVLGGDLTDDGGGQTLEPTEGPQLLQFSQRYQEGSGEDRVHCPVYIGLGNHDLDQDGPNGRGDWYRRELRDYVEVNHRVGVFFKPPVPVESYHVPSDSYSWNWGGLHLIQLHRFGGDTSKGAVSCLDWLSSDLAGMAADGRPVILFQHFGWDHFSREYWDPTSMTFDSQGKGLPHWWSDTDRSRLLDVVRPYNVVGLFHGHEHDTPMIYQANGIDMFKPIAAYKGGFALVRLARGRMDVALCMANFEGRPVFTHAFTKMI